MTQKKWFKLNHFLNFCPHAAVLTVTLCVAVSLRLCGVSFQCDSCRIPLPVNARPLSTSDGSEGSDPCQLHHVVPHLQVVAPFAY